MTLRPRTRGGPPLGALWRASPRRPRLPEPFRASVLATVTAVAALFGVFAGTAVLFVSMYLRYALAWAAAT